MEPLRHFLGEMPQIQPTPANRARSREARVGYFSFGVPTVSLGLALVTYGLVEGESGFVNPLIGAGTLATVGIVTLKGPNAWRQYKVWRIYKNGFKAWRQAHPQIPEDIAL